MEEMGKVGSDILNSAENAKITNDSFIYLVSFYNLKLFTKMFVDQKKK